MGKRDEGKTYMCSLQGISSAKAGGSGGWFVFCFPWLLGLPSSWGSDCQKLTFTSSLGVKAVSVTTCISPRWWSCAPGAMARPHCVVIVCRWHAVIKWHEEDHILESSLKSFLLSPSSFRPSRNSSLGIYSRYSSQSWEKPRINQVGRPVRRRLQIFKIRSCGSALGEEEKQQQHDLWETQPGYEVSWEDAIESWGT